MAFVVRNINPQAEIISLKSNFIFEWEIDNFHSTEDYLIESPKFTTNGLDGEIQWCMRLHKHTGAAYTDDELTLYINTTAKNLVNSGECFFVILNNAGDVLAKVNEVGKSSTAYSDTLGYVAFTSQNCTEYSLDYVISNYDKIKIMGGLGVMLTYKEKKIDLCEQITTMCKHEKVIEKQQDHQDLSGLAVIAKYDALFNNIKFSDVSLISEGKAVKAHRCILANSSSVFSAMFDAEMQEKRENTVEITDIKYDVLVEMVRYIYTGKVDDMDTLAGELAAAADKYALDELKNSCENSILKRLSLDNVFYCSQLADRLNMKKLKEKTIKFMVEYARNITEKPEFKLLPFDVVHEVCRGLAQKYQ